MTLYIDNRKGSKELYAYIRGVDKCLGVYDGDFELLGWGPDDAPIAVGGEYKTIQELLTSMRDGRVYGTQIARMLQVYQRVYLLVEGRWRVSQDGQLEFLHHVEKLKRGALKEVWFKAFDRNGGGWTADEFFGRIESIEEFPGVRVRFAGDKYASADLLIRIYKYWSKLYSEHRSHMAWDQSNTGRQPQNVLLPTSQLPLVTRCARELMGIGQTKAHFIGSHFGTLANMVLAQEDEWAKVEIRTPAKNGAKRGSVRTQHLSTGTIGQIQREIWTGEKGKEK